MSSDIIAVTPSRFPHDTPAYRQATEMEKVAAAMNALNANGHNLFQAPFSCTVEIAASSTTDGMDITVTMLDRDGNTLAAVVEFDAWMSESASGLGLTGDTYSGDLTAGTGAILGAYVSKKSWKLQTAATGIFVGTLVASANPTDQYVVVQLPFGFGRVISAVSGTNWEGAS